jgi:hypothetical protein
MKVIRRRSAASRPIVKDGPSGAEIGHELQERVHVLRYRLWKMIYVGDGEVGRENRRWVAEDQIVASVEYPFLAFGKMIQTEEARPLACILLADCGQGAPHSSSVVLEEDGKPVAGKVSDANLRE